MVSKITVTPNIRKEVFSYYPRLKGTLIGKTKVPSKKKGIILWLGVTHKSEFHNIYRNRDLST